MKRTSLADSEVVDSGRDDCKDYAEGNERNDIRTLHVPKSHPRQHRKQENTAHRVAPKVYNADRDTAIRVRNLTVEHDDERVIQSGHHPERDSEEMRFVAACSDLVAIEHCDADKRNGERDPFFPSRALTQQKRSKHQKENRNRLMCHCRVCYRGCGERKEVAQVVEGRTNREQPEKPIIALRKTRRPPPSRDEKKADHPDDLKSTEKRKRGNLRTESQKKRVGTEHRHGDKYEHIAGDCSILFHYPPTFYIECSAQSFSDWFVSVVNRRVIVKGKNRPARQLLDN